MKNRNFYFASMFFLLALFSTSCDKKGNPLPSEIKFSAKLNGVDYLDQMPMILPPGARRTPVMEIEHLGTNKSYTLLRSLLIPVNQTNKSGNFYLTIRIPSVESLTIGRPYTFEVIQGEDKLTRIDENVYEDENRQFVSISSSSFMIDTDYYGTGTVTFSRYDTVKNKVKGTVDFTFAYDGWKDSTTQLKLIGDFFCSIINNY